MGGGEGKTLYDWFVASEISAFRVTDMQLNSVYVIVKYPFIHFPVSIEFIFN